MSFQNICFWSCMCPKGFLLLQKNVAVLHFRWQFFFWHDKKCTAAVQVLFDAKLHKKTVPKLFTTWSTIFTEQTKPKESKTKDWMSGNQQFANEIPFKVCHIFGDLDVPTLKACPSPCIDRANQMFWELESREEQCDPLCSKLGGKLNLVSDGAPDFEQRSTPARSSDFRALLESNHHHDRCHKNFRGAKVSERSTA